MKHHIVAEVSVNYDGNKTPDALLSQRFEQVINYNEERGYDLDSWQIHRVMTEGVLNETIIAVFVKTA